MFKIPLFSLSSVFYTSCTKKEPYLFIGKTHKFKNCLNLMTLVIFFEVFLLKMFVACMWPTHTILSQLGKRKKPLYKGFCFLLSSKILRLEN